MPRISITAALRIVWLVGAAFWAVAIGACVTSAAQAGADAIAIEKRELKIGTKVAPPFAIKDRDGNWSGISIELWQRIATELKWRYRSVELPTVSALLEEIQSGDLDAGIAAITVTQAREQIVDFTMPYFHAGSGIAVQADRISNWKPVIQSITSFGFVQAILTLLGLALSAGTLIWLFERKANESFKGGGTMRGIASGVWWSTTTMTQSTASGLLPVTLPGRLVAMVWMVASVISIAVFTAGITSALTTKRLHGIVGTLADLSSVRVGAVGGTATEQALARTHLDYRPMASPQDGLAALKTGAIEALVYDRPLLAWMIRQDGAWWAELTDLTFDEQPYAIAVGNGSELRKPINVALLGATETPWWRDILFRYGGVSRLEMAR